MVIDQKIVGTIVAKATISTKYQVVIPKEIRNEMSIECGQVVQVIAKRGVITLIPDQPLGNLRGSLKGADTRGVRDKKDRQ